MSEQQKLLSERDRERGYRVVGNLLAIRLGIPIQDGGRLVEQACATSQGPIKARAEVRKKKSLTFGADWSNFCVCKSASVSSPTESGESAIPEEAMLREKVNGFEADAPFVLLHR